MTNGESVGGMTTITGEYVLVTPSGEIVGSTTPEVFRRGGRRQRGSSPPMTPAPPPITPRPPPPQEQVTEPVVGPRETLFGAPTRTFGGLQEDIIRGDISRQEREFRALSPEEARARALRGEPGFVGMSVPGGQEIAFTPQIRRVGFGETVRESFRRGEFFQRLGGSVTVGATRLVSGTGEASLEAITGGIPTATRPTLPGASQLAAIPSDPVQVATQVAPIGAGVGAGAVGFVRTARAGGIGTALRGVPELVSPLRIPSGRRFVPRVRPGEPEIVDVFRTPRGATTEITGIGRTPSGEVTRVFGGTGRRLRGGEEVFAGREFARGDIVEVAGGRPTVTPTITRRPVREIVSPGRVETPIQAFPFGAARVPRGRGFIGEEMAGFARPTTGDRFIGVGGRRVSPVAGSEAGFVPETLIRGTIIRPRETGLTSFRGGGITRRPRPITRPTAVETGLFQAPRPAARDITLGAPTSGLRFPAPPPQAQVTQEALATPSFAPVQPLTITRATPRTEVTLFTPFQPTAPRLQPQIPRGAPRITPAVAPRQAPRLVDVVVDRPRMPTEMVAPRQPPITLLPRFTFRPSAARPFGGPGLLPGFGIPEFRPGPPIRRPQRQRRRPTFEAIFFDIRAPRPAPGEITGLVRRPILI